MRGPQGELSSPLLPYHHQQLSFFPQKPDYTSSYPDFSAPCLATAPHTYPEHTYLPTDWSSEVRRRLNPEMALGSGDLDSSSPNLIDGSGCIDEEEDYGGPKKGAKRKKESQGQSRLIYITCLCVWGGSGYQGTRTTFYGGSPGQKSTNGDTKPGHTHRDLFHLADLSLGHSIILL